MMDFTAFANMILNLYGFQFGVFCVCDGHGGVGAAQSATKWVTVFNLNNLYSFFYKIVLDVSYSGFSMLNLPKIHGYLPIY